MDPLFSHISLLQKTLQYITYFTKMLEDWRGNLENSFVGYILMSYSKGFNWVTHDPLIAKLAAYGFDLDFLCYIYSYLASRK